MSDLSAFDFEGLNESVSTIFFKGPAPVSKMFLISGTLSPGTIDLS